MKTQLINRRKNKNFDISIGRDSIFGNPHRLGWCKICNRPHDRIDCLIAYKEYFYKRLLTDIDFRDNIEKLRGKILGCWCNPLPCHGNVIIEYLDGIPYEFEKPNHPETTDFFC